MNLFNDCPECGKQLTKSRKHCACGWKIAEIKECQVIDKKCGFMLVEGSCREIGTIAPHGSSGKWYCGLHWYEAMNTLLKK